MRYNNNCFNCISLIALWLLINSFVSGSSAIVLLFFVVHFLLHAIKYFNTMRDCECVIFI